MIDLRDRIKEIINTEKENGHFFVLGDNAINLIQQIFNNYEKLNSLHQDFENIPKQAELVFVAAPTGAGKDSLVIKLNKQNPDRKYIELNIDIFRHYYSEFMTDVDELNDKSFAIQTNQFSYEIYRTIQEILLTEFPGTNVIITGTLRETGWVEETFRNYKANSYTDYTIKLVSLAVPKKESAVSVIQRYVMIVDSQLESGDFIPGTSRYTPKWYHDETFDKFPKSLEYFENINYNIDENGNRVLKPESERLIDTYEVYRRSKAINDYDEDTLVYSSDRENNESSSALEAVQVLRNSNVEFSHEAMVKLLQRVHANSDYFKSQGVLREIVLDMANLLEYEKVIKKLQVSQKLDNDDNEEPRL